MVYLLKIGQVVQGKHSYLQNKNVFMPLESMGKEKTKGVFLKHIISYIYQQKIEVKLKTKQKYKNFYKIVTGLCTVSVIVKIIYY